MTYQPVTIPGFEQGLIQNQDPHLIPDDAQPTLFNAYQWRKRINKKGGNRWLGLEGRIGVRLLPITFPGAIPATVDDLTVFGLTAVPIEPGTLTYYDGATTYTDTPTTMILGALTGVPGSTIDYTTGAIAGFPPLVGAGYIRWIRLIDAYSPVMGLRIKESPAINNEELIAFDRRSAYSFNAATNVFDYTSFFKDTNNPCYWTGTNYQFFQSCNAYGAMFATNGGYGWFSLAHEEEIVISATEGPAPGGLGDPIRWYDGSGWVNFIPPLATPGVGSRYLLGGKFVVQFKSRLIVLNTWEGITNKTSAEQHRNRMRYCKPYSPFYSKKPVGTSAVDAESWFETPGKGGAIDFPTSEAISGVGFYKDLLVVFFERSTWLVASTGDSNNPFVLQKINPDFGCESPDSTIQFDDSILAVGNTGITATTNVSSERMDQKIPDLVFAFHNENHGIERVHGIRNFFPQMAMWTYRESES